MSDDKPAVAVLIPYRPSGDDHRARLCRHVTSWWADEFPAWPIVRAAGPTAGPFQRAAALNEAAAIADDAVALDLEQPPGSSRWDVAVLTDADTIVPPGQIEQAVHRATKSGRMTLGYDLYVAINRRGTRSVLEGAAGVLTPTGWRRHRLATYHGTTVSSLVVVRRDLWDKAQGFDEQFVGWGWEDSSFALVAESVAGPIDRVPGPCWHLWHPTSPERSRRSPTYEANRARYAAYVRAFQNEDRAELLRLAHGGEP